LAGGGKYLRQRFDPEADFMAESLAETEAVEGIGAFFEKRKFKYAKLCKT